MTPDQFKTYVETELGGFRTGERVLNDPVSCIRYEHAYSMYYIYEGSLFCVFCNRDTTDPVLVRDRTCKNCGPLNPIKPELVPELIEVGQRWKFDNEIHTVIARHQHCQDSVETKFGVDGFGWFHEFNIRENCTYLGPAPTDNSATLKLLEKWNKEDREDAAMSVDPGFDNPVAVQVTIDGNGKITNMEARHPERIHSGSLGAPLPDPPIEFNRIDTTGWPKDLIALSDKQEKCGRDLSDELRGPMKG